MWLLDELAESRRQFDLLSFYGKFEHIVLLFLTGLIAIVIVFAVWHLAIEILINILASSFDPTDYPVFQASFGMIFTVLIALEFKRSLLIVAERQSNVVQVRTVVLIALLATLRKLLIIDPSSRDAFELMALSFVIFALGAVYSLVRHQDRQERTRERRG